MVSSNFIPPFGSTSGRYLGIDFSGNLRMWSSGCRKSNVWIAEVEYGASLARLTKLRSVQQLGSNHNPFNDLVEHLRQSEFDAAAIDAPFSIPKIYLPSDGHTELLDRVANPQLCDGRHFPSARDFVDCVLKGQTPRTRKPLRQTEAYWLRQNVNVRSTLWTGPRGGAAMTAACLKLLHEAQRPIWPWARNGRCLLVEAFPAAQLCQWRLPYQAYSRNNEQETATRKKLYDRLQPELI
jgi:hypothetical protein